MGYEFVDLNRSFRELSLNDRVSDDVDLALAEAQERTGENLLFHASLKGSDTPAMISDPVWFPYESTWQAVAKLRLDHGLDVFSLTLNYEEDYQVNANLTAAIEGAGFKLGGEFKKHLSTVWTMSGHFGAKRKD